MAILRAVAFAAGLFVVLGTLGSAMRTVLLPRGIPARIARFVFLQVRRLFRLRAGPRASYARRDRVMALYAPAGLLVLLATWLALLLVGFAAMFWSLGGRSIGEAFTLSGSSLFTLGFARAAGGPAIALVFVEAILGLGMVALLITYMPSLYAAFSRREQMVKLLEVRAGNPPSGVQMIERYHRLGRLDRLTDVWERWELWFVDLEETHTTFPSLTFFRSSLPEHHWVTAAGTVLDGASLMLSTVDVPRDHEAALSIRAGYIALRRIAAFFRIPYDPDPLPDDPISIGRNEFDAVYDRLSAGGVPVVADRDQAWRDFSGWRVNYDAVLLALAGLTMAPEAEWTSDRSVWRPPPSVLRRMVGAAAGGRRRRGS